MPRFSSTPMLYASSGTAESSAAPKSEEELQRIIKAQRYRVHPYLYLSDDLKLADWSDTQWCLDDAHHAMELYYMPKLASVGRTLYQLDPTCQELDWIKQHAQWPYDKISVRTYVPHRGYGAMHCSEES